MIHVRALVALLTTLVACDLDTRAVPQSPGGDAAVDAGLDAAADADAADATVDAGPADMGTPSVAVPLACDRGGCPSGASCFREVCLDTCGARALPFADGDLSSSLRPLWTLCPRLGTGATAALGARLFHAQAETAGRVTTVTLTQHALEPTQGRAPAPACRLEFTADQEAVARLDAQLALSPGGRWAHVAVDLYTPAPEYRRLGAQTALVDLSTCEARVETHAQFRGAALLSEDPADLLTMRGTSTTRPGVFLGAVEVAAGEVWLMRYGTEHVLASLYSGHGSRALSMFSVEALRRGPHPVRGGASTFSEWPGRAPQRLANGDLLGHENVVGGGDFLRHPIAGQDLSQLTHREPVFFASKTFSDAAPAEGTRRVALVYEGGVLVVED